MVTIGVKAKKLRNSAIAMIVLSSVLIVLFTFISLLAGIGMLVSGEDASSVGAVIGLLVFLVLLMVGCLVGYSIFLSRINRCPEVLIAREGDMLQLYCKEQGMLTLPCESVMQATPVKTFFTASLIGLLSERYDATIEITTTDGRKLFVPYVRYAKQIAGEVMRIAYEVRVRKQQQPADVAE